MPIADVGHQKRRIAGVSLVELGRLFGQGLRRRLHDVLLD